MLSDSIHRQGFLSHKAALSFCCHPLHDILWILWSVQVQQHHISFFSSAISQSSPRLEDPFLYAFFLLHLGLIYYIIWSTDLSFLLWWPSFSTIFPTFKLTYNETNYLLNILKILSFKIHSNICEAPTKFQAVSWVSGTQEYTELFGDSNSSRPVL